MVRIVECPTCGSRKIRRITRDLERTVGKVCYVVPQLEFEECPDCGECLLDHAAMQRIERFRDAAMKGKSRSLRKRKSQVGAK